MCYRPSSVQGTTCPECGATNGAGKTECMYCGTDLTALISGDAAADSQAANPTSPAAPASPGAPGAPAAPTAPKPPAS